MRRALIALAATLIVLAAALVAAERAGAARLAPFVLPEAAGLSVTPAGPQVVAISYHTSSPAWRRRLSQQLIAAGWSVHSYENPGAGQPQWAFVSWYTRDTPLGLAELRERAHFIVDRADPSHVELRVARELAWVWPAALPGAP